MTISISSFSFLSSLLSMCYLSISLSLYPFPNTKFCIRQRFLFCLSSYLFSEWHIVPQLYIQIKQSRTRSRKALSGCKASRRLGKHIRGLSRFLSTSTQWLSRLRKAQQGLSSAPRITSSFLLTSFRLVLPMARILLPMI